MRSPNMMHLFELIEQVGPAGIPVLVCGETGSGKEVVAEQLHDRSSRSQRPMFRVNCAGLTESLVESELFGHERGAFTGATQTYRGVFETAHLSTLFLDELGELSLRTQAKLLRVLESGEFTRLGSTETRRVDVRLIAATHRPLEEMMAAGTFRRDLYYRLCGARLTIPPLRARNEEIVPIARRFLSEVAEARGRSPLELDGDAQQILTSYAWPGNVRQLRNVVEYAFALSNGNSITAAALRSALGLDGPKPPTELASVTEAAESPLDDTPADQPPDLGLREQVKRFEVECIRKALERHQGNQTQAARHLQISRRALTKKLSEYGFERPRKSVAPSCSSSQS